MIQALLLLLLTIPITSRSAWMSPDAFRLKLGMTRDAATKRLHTDGWEIEKGKNDDLIVKYDEKRTVTLGFTGAKLHSIRFELVDFIPEIEKAYAEREQVLVKQYGNPKKIGGPTKLLQFDRVMPNVHLVRSVDPASSFGEQGLGFVVVRYFDPAVK